MLDARHPQRSCCTRAAPIACSPGTQPGVAYTSTSLSVCGPGSTPECSTLSRLALPLPVDTGAAVPGDGIVQLRSGDTLTVTYQQPTGSTVEAHVVVP